MIQLNTLCLIVWTERHPEVLGMECTVIASRSSPEHYTVRLRNAELANGPRKCFMPILPPAKPAWIVEHDGERYDSERIDDILVKLREIIPYTEDNP